MKNEKYEKILKDAKERFTEGMNHLDFHNRYFGIGTKFMPATQEERKEYFESGVPQEIMRMRDELMKQQPDVKETGEGIPLPGGKKYSGTIYIRAPKSLHQALAEEADREEVSLNQLCITKLSVLLNKAVRP